MTCFSCILIPRNLNGSLAFWYSKHLDLYCLTEHKGKPPKYFLTYTQNDHWPELQRLIKHGVKMEFELTHSKDWFQKEFANKPHMKELFEPTQFHSTVNHPVEAAKAFDKRFKMVQKIIIDPQGGPLGKVTDFWWRREYQSRGSVHIHAVYWTDDLFPTPEDDVIATLPTYNPIKDKNNHIKLVAHTAVKKFMIHNCA